MRRNIFSRVNKFQKQIVYPVLVCCLIGCMLALLFLDYLYFDRSALIHHFGYKNVKTIILWVLPLGSCLLLLLALWICYETNKIAGASERIIKELDGILTTNKKKKIVVRKDDEIYVELLHRINSLIDRLP